MIAAPSMDEMAEYLVREGLVGQVNGETVLSTRAVALLTNVAEESLSFVAKRAQDGRAHVSDSFGRDMRRGAAEVRAASGSDDMITVLYRRAVAETKEVRRPRGVDESLRELDG